MVERGWVRRDIIEYEGNHMNKRRKVGWRELILMVVPALALVGWGFWLQSRRPFKLVIDEIKVAPVSKGTRMPPEPNTRGVQVIVFIGHEGPAPDWWGRGVNATSYRVHFTGKGEKDKHDTNAGGYTGVSFDKSLRQYTFTYTGDVPKDPRFLKQATCHVSASLETQRVPPEKLAAAKASIPAHKFN
jgi:hypothetical protein